MTDPTNLYDDEEQAYPPHWLPELPAKPGVQVDGYDIAQLSPGASPTHQPETDPYPAHWTN